MDSSAEKGLAVRSSVPMPDNPWPHDMVITLEDTPRTLLDLLWIREAWGLEPVGEDLPPRLVATPEPVDDEARECAPIAQWQDAWPGLWRECLAFAGTPKDPSVLEHFQHAVFDAGAGTGADAEADAAERVALIRQLSGPSWHERFGTVAFTDQKHAWDDNLFDEEVMQPHRDMERKVLDALVPAWESGLRIVVQIPCRGTFTRTITPHALLVTSETREIVTRYTQALNTFGHTEPV